MAFERKSWSYGRLGNTPQPDIRQQLCDQLKCLDVKLDTEVSIVYELQEFFRRRAEVELDYARNLDKLVKQMITRHRAEKQKQEQWATMSTYACWKHLLGITRKESQNHSVMSDVYGTQMVQRLQEVIENSQRIYRKCRDIGAESHDDILKVLSELQSAMKTYHIYQADAKQAELKLRSVESQKTKVEQQLSGKNSTSRKLKGLERQAEKKQQKYSENKLKALKARNDYLLCIEAANAAISKYFSDDISDLMDCMDFGYHNSVGRAMMMYLSIHEHLRNEHQKFVDSLNKCITDLDSRADKQKFMELNNQVFMLPKKFEFQPFKGDEIRQISAQKEVQEDLIQRYNTITDRLGSLKVENDEVWKTLETTEKMLVDMIQIKDYDITRYFVEEPAPPRSPHEAAKHRSDRIETESYYLEKFREYTISCNRLARLQSKFNQIQKALGDNQISTTGAPRAPALPPKPKKRRIGRTPPVGQPKLFGGSLEEYIEATGEEIPLVIKSCIRVINLYGMHHQGVFRVSGAQVEINHFKNTFESGEDALAEVVDASDMNSIAGVLKLYFRELREPLFPLHLFDALVECTRENDVQRRLERIKDLLATLPRSIFVVMRYLFAFLNHLSEYSDENMMDPYNLAICFGPTLLPIPPDRDQVSYQASVNEIIKTIIMHQEEIFPNDGGEIYEKCILENSRNSVDAVDEDDEDETSSIPSDEEGSIFEPEVKEATALHDYEGRSGRELSFKKGEVLILYTQVSHDWWEGCCHGQEGLIPDKYIAVKTTQREDARHQAGEDKTSSTQSLPAKGVTRQVSSDSGLEASDKSTSASQPNIVIRETDIIGVESPDPTPLSTSSSNTVGSRDMTSSVSSGSDLSPIQEDHEQLQSSSAVSSPSSLVDSSMSTSITSESGADELSLDIDHALEEVMAGLKSLEMQQKSDKRMSLPLVKLKQTPKHTPDLVLDLPEGSNTPPSHDSSEPDSPTTAAETFAKSNQGTLKKASGPMMTSSTTVAIPATGALPTSQFQRNTSPANRLSISSEPGDLSSSQVHMSTFGSSAFKRSQQASMPSVHQIRQQAEFIISLTSGGIAGGVLGDGGSPGSGLHTTKTGPSGTTPTPPPVAQKPRVPVKVKPPVMKKPTKPDPPTSSSGPGQPVETVPKL
ncbi:SLIT-ROBO Rho GTPase-activating protein 3-like isoform X1 [Pomacea canaliculata]|uniref:SLIT-ROBO Rho GTPase-activating protein 3-like isoform X1 n=1 Tax=Pomacea canaliculata TaxID=400727 RepID=UPI000D73B9DD|nr:SLIT-ROBO Rho GTPase-activating protein 3-like isoform X1 [Pomacea canaliculata]